MLHPASHAGKGKAGEHACSEQPLGEGGGQLVLIQIQQLCCIGQGLIPAHCHAVIARSVKLDVAKPQDGGQQQPDLLLRAPTVLVRRGV